MAWYIKWAIMVIAAAIGLGGYNGIPWCKMGIAEWAYWIGAIGTIGTLIGTIWLATSENRRRREHALSTARIVIAKMQFPMIQTALAALRISNTLEEYQARIPTEQGLIQRMPQKWKNLGDELSAQEYWSADELVALLALDRSKAQFIAEFQSQILFVSKQLTGISSSERTVPQIMSDVQRAIKILRGAATSLSKIGEHLSSDTAFS
ncbi:hypothetical protein [Janthinobacterium sp. AD80]|uniref:hypothetical protein n=1 Tax=Janthinobacterium sp. AD80 TaxID=1528773 RepID=UPI000C821957|nr:hypothetical protein [Janthinobacterium sp. AD80]PMQ15846.1 hypothetical protein JaAD80_13675 [Janthinobacterium sp. AD80]